MKAKINTQIKFYHNPTRAVTALRANANAVSKSLAHLDQPWVIDHPNNDELVVYCTAASDEAIVLPQLQSVDYIRWQHGAKTVTVRCPFIMSGRMM